MKIRKIGSGDRNVWARMRNLLWPSSLKEHLAGIDDFFSENEIDVVEVFVLERADKLLGGFLELNIRNYAEGTNSQRVPYIEGWYVDADLRGSGYGKQLVLAAEPGRKRTALMNWPVTRNWTTQAVSRHMVRWVSRKLSASSVSSKNCNDERNAIHRCA